MGKLLTILQPTSHRFSNLPLHKRETFHSFSKAPLQLTTSSSKPILILGLPTQLEFSIVSFIPRGNEHECTNTPLHLLSTSSQSSSSLLRHSSSDCFFIPDHVVAPDDEQQSPTAGNPSAGCLHESPVPSQSQIQQPR